jgi:hypothetical protein
MRTVMNINTGSNIKTASTEERARPVMGINYRLDHAAVSFADTFTFNVLTGKVRAVQK